MLKIFLIWRANGDNVSGVKTFLIWGAKVPI